MSYQVLRVYIYVISLKRRREKEMATHSSTRAWRIPGTEEPGGLPYGVAQSRTRLKQLSSSSSSSSSMKRHKTIIELLSLFFR